jgi:DNA polymerase-3 subunit gamma/tau
MGYYSAMTYQVLARTWRPQRFEELLGQDAVVQTLRNALAAGTLGHAYLFSGLRGVGKTTAARLLAKAVNCAEGPTPDPCGECVSCREIAEGSSLDVVELDAATHTGVDDVRDLQELLRFHPTRDRFRVVIVDEVHMLSKAAFNALLKSIEEPPSYVLWVFATTERHRVPATILSRCQQLEFRPVASDLITSRILEIARSDGFTVTPEAADAISRAAEGSVRDGLSLLDQLRAFASDQVDEDAVAAVLGVPRFDVMVGLITALADGDTARGLAAIREELASGHDATVLFKEAGRVLRSLVHLSVSPDLAGSFTDEQREMLRPLADRLGIEAVSRMLGLWIEQEPLLRETANRELAVEVAALRLARWPAVQRVERLLAGGGEVSPPPTTGAGSVGEPSAGGVSSAGSAPERGNRLARALWETQPRLASAVECARLEQTGPVVVLRFPPDAEAFARFAASDEAKGELEEACRGVFGGVGEVRVELEGGGSATGGANGGLEREVREDPAVELARQVLGGEIVAVRPDREGA